MKEKSEEKKNNRSRIGTNMTFVLCCILFVCYLDKYVLNAAEYNWFSISISQMDNENFISFSVWFAH